MDENESRKEGNKSGSCFAPCTGHDTGDLIITPFSSALLLLPAGRKQVFSVWILQKSSLSVKSFFPPSPYFFCPVPPLVIEDERLLTAGEMEGRILQFIFIFLAVGGDVCPKCPDQLWDVEHNERSFYFSSWQSVWRFSKTLKQPKPQPNIPLLCSL